LKSILRDKAPDHIPTQIVSDDSSSLERPKAKSKTKSKTSYAMLKVPL
jgi:hypothetical protein